MTRLGVISGPQNAAPVIMRYADESRGPAISLMESRTEQIGPGKAWWPERVIVSLTGDTQIWNHVMADEYVHPNPNQLCGLGHVPWPL